MYINVRAETFRLMKSPVRYETVDRFVVTEKLHSFVLRHSESIRGDVTPSYELPSSPFSSLVSSE